MTWLQQIKGGVIVNLRVVPRSSKNEFCGVIGDAFKIKLQAPPHEGRANKALIEFISDRVGVSKKNITILSGETCRVKRILIAGATEEKIRKMFILFCLTAPFMVYYL